MNKLSKIIITLVLSIIMLFSLTITVVAAEYEVSTTATAIEEEAEETGWIFRSNNGVLEMRLWSYTYGKWLTEWMPAY